MRDFHLCGRSETISVNGMCATSHPLAAQVAVKIMEDGGNAVDAAIGAAVILGLCEPQSTGLGGDCFALIKPPGEERVLALNGSGRAPVALNAERMRLDGHSEIPVDSADAVTIPGAVDAFCRLSADWGRLGLAASLSPAIAYAKEGIPVSPRVAFDWANCADRLQGRARDYYLFAGRPPRSGATFRAPSQANVLEKIVSQGRAGFYEGEVAQDMVDSLRASGGVHTLGDFSDCNCSYSEPIDGGYGDVSIIEHPPNGQGATALLLAKILAHFQVNNLEPFGVERTHIETEAAKLALDARDRFIADFDFTNRLDHMLSDEVAKKLSNLIEPNGVIEHTASRTGSVHKDTVLVVVVDRDRMAVSMIYSIFHGFGSGLASSRFGINFQNRGAGFNLQKGHPNEAAGGKRPLHTIIPAMLRKNGRVVMPFGVMGGQYQAVGHMRLISNIVDFGMCPQTALDGPRSFPESGSLQLERGYSSEVRRGLEQIGHITDCPVTPLGGGQAIVIDHDSGTLRGASDHRKDGCALGY